MEIEKLKAPFTVGQIHFRVGATNLNKDGSLKWDNKDYPGQAVGIPLAYVDARDVMVRLDEVFGMSGWQCEYPFVGCCRIGVKVGITPPVMHPDKGRQTTGTEWIWKSNGAGATDIEGEKGQYSDAFKRAAVLYGIAQYLYDMPNIWIPINQKNRVFTKESLSDLRLRYDRWVEKYFRKTE